MEKEEGETSIAQLPVQGEACAEKIAALKKCRGKFKSTTMVNDSKPVSTRSLKAEWIACQISNAPIVNEVAASLDEEPALQDRSNLVADLSPVSLTAESTLMDTSQHDPSYLNGTSASPAKQPLHRVSPRDARRLPRSSKTRNAADLPGH